MSIAVYAKRVEDLKIQLGVSSDRIRVLEIENARLRDSLAEKEKEVKTSDWGVPDSIEDATPTATILIDENESLCAGGNPIVGILGRCINGGCECRKVKEK